MLLALAERTDAARTQPRNKIARAAVCARRELATSPGLSVAADALFALSFPAAAAAAAAALAAAAVPARRGNFILLYCLRHAGSSAAA